MSAGSIRAAVPPARLVPVVLLLVVVGLAVAFGTGAIGVPDPAEATSVLGDWVYLVVVALIFLETTALLGFLVHGELVLLIGGAAAAERGGLTLVVMILLAACAAVAGDVVSCLLGRRLGRPFLDRHMRRAAPQLARADGFFARHGGKAVVVGRFTGFFRATLPFIAGSSGMPLRRLAPFSVVSALAWSAIFVSIGYASAESLAGAGDTASRIALVTVLAAIAAFVLYSAVRRRSRGRR